jgi:fructose transport system permease protein
MAVDHGVPPLLALLIGMVVGIALGSFNGFLVTKVGLPPFIVTLGTFYIYGALGLVYSQAQTISKEDLGGDHSLLLWTGRQISIGAMKITTGVLFVLVLYIVFNYILSNTAWGRHVYATGDDKEAARLAGIDVNRVLMSVYMVAGALYCAGGWVQLGRSLSASSNAPPTSTSNRSRQSSSVERALRRAWPAVGNSDRRPHRGRVRIGLSLAGVNPYYQNFAIGALILVAVTLDQWIRRVGK